MTVEYGGVASNAITVPMAAASPALFSATATGRGQGAILNQDGSVNSTSNPAPSGSIVVLFGTGEGLTDPAGIDGLLATGVYPKPMLPVTLTIGGQTAEVLYAGAAPTLVAGVFQINARVPSGLAAGATEVSVAVGNASSPAGITLSLR